MERGEEKGKVDHQATQVLLEYLDYLETEGILVYQELQVKWNGGSNLLLAKTLKAWWVEGCKRLLHRPEKLDL